MKTMLKLPAIILGMFLLVSGSTQTAKAQGEDISLQTFYDELSPYGVWINDPQYGYVWRPDVDQREFRPYYTNGRWVMTEYGNTWVSNYEWGWAPFHYGRWAYNRHNHWVWIPDTVWGPAWVTWRTGGGYYGWAPLGPSISIGINIGRNGYRVPDIYWNFVPYHHIYYTKLPRYYGGRNRIYIQNTVIINNTYVRNNRTYYTGPRAEEIRRATNQNVTVYNLNRNARPGPARIENNTVNIYTPRPSRAQAEDRRNESPSFERNERMSSNSSRGAYSMDRNQSSSSRNEVKLGPAPKMERNSPAPRMERGNPAPRVERNSPAPRMEAPKSNSGSSRNTGSAPSRSSRGESNSGNGRVRG